MTENKFDLSKTLFLTIVSLLGIVITSIALSGANGFIETVVPIGYLILMAVIGLLYWKKHQKDGIIASWERIESEYNNLIKYTFDRLVVFFILIFLIFMANVGFYYMHISGNLPLNNIYYAGISLFIIICSIITLFYGPILCIIHLSELLMIFSAKVIDNYVEENYPLEHYNRNHKKPTYFDIDWLW